VAKDVNLFLQELYIAGIVCAALLGDLEQMRATP
jgi:hypothetical protein